MDPGHDHERIQRIFQGALSLPRESRERYVREQCSDESERLEVKKLLQYDEVEGGGLTGDFDNRHLPTQDSQQKIPGRGDRLPADSSSSSGSSIDHGRFLPGTVLSDRYRVVGMLGKGGMGEVYRADDLELGQSVALKFLPQRVAGDARMLERFRGEVRLARQVSHPNVCRVYDIGQIDGQCFLSMEYVDGEDLAQLLRRIGRFPADRATELARQLCLGLHAAHEKGVLHRDLKPANIMIDGRGKLLITDFGLAEIADDVRDDDIRSGTPAYMSPEQLAGREVTQRSDIYSLGIILHEIYTGKPVWEARSMADLLEQRKSGPRPTPSSHLSDLDPLVDRVIERCLDPNPNKRPSAALNVIASLPGGDPLAAALGAGELPSPEIVAAAGDNARVDYRLAILSLLGLAASLLLVCWLQQKTSTINHSGLDYPPAVLRNEARKLVAKELDYAEAPAETIDGFGVLTSIDPRVISYWYRQRPEGTAFNIQSFWSSDWGRISWGRPEFFYPAFQKSGELALVLSGNGQLQYFRAAPEVNSFTEKTVSSPRWSKWFPPERIGYYLPDGPLDEPQDNQDNNVSDSVPVMTYVEDQGWTPPDAFDTVGVWRGGNPDDGTEFFIEAAAYRGKPTYFRKKTQSQQPRLDATHPPRRIVGWIYLLLLASSVYFAFRNISSGESIGLVQNVW